MKTVILLMVPLWLWAADDFAAQARTSALESGLKPAPKNYAELKVLFPDLRREEIVLGKALFFEPGLSKAGKISCATCHDERKGGADGKPTAVGHKGLKNPQHLNTPTAYNTGLSKRLFWDGRSTTLETQAAGPIAAAFEMAGDARAIEAFLNADDRYRKLFARAYGPDSVSFENVLKAIAVYERTLFTRSRYDRFLEGDLVALNTQEVRGLKLFTQNACVSCHSGPALGGEEMRKFPLRYHRIWSMEGLKGAKKLISGYREFSEAEFMGDESHYAYLMMNLGAHETAALKEGFFTHYPDGPKAAKVSVSCKSCHNDPAIKKASPFPFANTGGFLGEGERKYFRAPILRNVASSAPYFHNGAVKTLEEAIDLMGRHQLGRTFTKAEVDNLAAFLKSLDGDLIKID